MDSKRLPACLSELSAVDEDVKQMPQTFQMLGFDVIVERDVSVQQMRAAIKQTLLEQHYKNEHCPSCVAFYFSGHVMATWAQLNVRNRWVGAGNQGGGDVFEQKPM